MMRREDIGPASERVRKPHFNIHSPELLVCPYNTNHRVQKHRMPRHLVKCREEYGPSGIDICPYNFVHHIPSDKMKEHLEVIIFIKRLNFACQNFFIKCFVLSLIH